MCNYKLGLDGSGSAIQPVGVSIKGKCVTIIRRLSLEGQSLVLSSFFKLTFIPTVASPCIHFIGYKIRGMYLSCDLRTPKLSDCKSDDWGLGTECTSCICFLLQCEHTLYAYTITDPPQIHMHTTLRQEDSTTPGLSHTDSQRQPQKFHLKTKANLKIQNYIIHGYIKTRLFVWGCVIETV